MCFRFHTKSTNAQENTCALCLDVLPASTEGKVCEKCFKKHNFSARFQNYAKASATLASDPHNPNLQQHSHHHHHHAQHALPLREIEHRCNICKTIMTSAIKLQEHLIEHSFKGCEERGYSCYICSAVFTVSTGLQLHMDELHGNGSKPYDCNLCSDKFFFRAELENHLLEHESGRIKIKPAIKDEAKHLNAMHAHHNNNNVNNHNNNNKTIKCEEGESIEEMAKAIVPKTEVHSPDDDEEYIEVEKVIDVAPADTGAGIEKNARPLVDSVVVVGGDGVGN